MVHNRSEFKLIISVPLLQMLKTFRITSNVKKLFSLASTVKNVKTMSTQDVIFESINNAGVMTLNRPKALNALDLSMVSKIVPTLNRWRSEKSLVIVKGSGGKAFCAGGDVRAVVEAGRRGDRLGHDFFRTEYTMNGLIGEYSIPYVSLLDGIVMGGGVGISIHGSYRVATEKSLFAMPETAIGLFPDVGGSYVLPRLEGKLGYYLALTGYRLKGVDVTRAGIATHYCESGKINDLEKELLTCGNHSSVKGVLGRFSSEEKTEFSLKPVVDKINTCFAGETMEGIIERYTCIFQCLENCVSNFACPYSTRGAVQN